MMKTAIVLAIFLAVASARFEYEAEWNLWKTKYGKMYESDTEELRQQIWASNLDFVTEHNKLASLGNVTFTVAMNEFADLTINEFVSIYNGYRSDLKTPSSNIHVNTGQIAASVDWREKGAVTGVKNQGQCGSCWSFSSTGSLEGQYFLKHGTLVSLSEQQLCDCSRSFGNNGCKGGLMDNAFRYLQTVAGDEREMDYPYTAEDSKYCKYEASRAVPGTSDTGHVDILRGSEEGLKNALSSVGPISVAMDAGHSSFQLYHSGVYKESKCSSTKLDHGVLAVGYGSEFLGGDYWIVKNSWGTRWGMEGFFKIAQEGNMCGICTQASYPRL